MHVRQIEIGDGARRGLERHQRIARLELDGVVDQDQGGGAVGRRERLLVIERGVIVLARAVEGGGLVTVARHVAEGEHNLALDVHPCIVVVTNVLGGYSKAGEDDRRRNLAGTGQATDLEVGAELERDFLTQRSVEDQRGRPIQLGAAHHGKRLEVAAGGPARFKACLGKLVCDIVGGHVETLGADAASLAFVGGEEEDVLFQSCFAGLVAKERRRSQQSENEKCKCVARFQKTNGHRLGLSAG